MKNRLQQVYSLLFILLISISSCSDDDDSPSPVNINFYNTELGVSDASVAAEIVFSRAATSSGTLTVDIATSDLAYGEDADFYTEPAASNNQFTLDIQQGDESVSFDVLPGTALNISEDKSITFTISVDDEANYQIGTYNELTVTFSENYIVPSASVATDIGGNERDNLFFLNLRKGTSSTINRNTFDLALQSSVDDYNILLNACTNMMAVKTDKTTFSDVTAQDTVDLALNGIDNADVASDGAMFSGEYSETVFYGWDNNGDESNVYIINRGDSTYGGANRGWKKVQISKSGSDYVVHAANLDGTEEASYTISKSADYNFKYVHFNNGEVTVEPESTNWDLVLATAIQTVSYGGSYHSYNSVSAFHNYFGSTKVAVIDLDNVDISYDDISLSDAQTALENSDSEYDLIGINWRGLDQSYTYAVNDNLVYLFEDAEGNVFKLQFTDYYNQQSEIEPQLKYSHLE